LRDSALAAKANDLASLEAKGNHERKHWLNVQRQRFVQDLGLLGIEIIPQMISLVEAGDGVYQELCHEVEGVLFRMPVDYQVHRALNATLVCSYCGQGCVTQRVDGLEDLGRAYEAMAVHEAYCLDSHVDDTEDGGDPWEHERRGMATGPTPDQCAAMERAGVDTLAELQGVMEGERQ
jgi:hypothetical protein